MDKIKDICFDDLTTTQRINLSAIGIMTMKEYNKLLQQWLDLKFTSIKKLLSILNEYTLAYFQRIRLLYKLTTNPDDVLLQTQLNNHIRQYDASLFNSFDKQLFSFFLGFALLKIE